MSEPEHTERPEPTPSAEVHREREIIVTNSGGRGSGVSTALVVVFALVALAIVAVIAFIALSTFDRDGGEILPDGIDITVVPPSTDEGS